MFTEVFTRSPSGARVKTQVFTHYRAHALSTEPSPVHLHCFIPMTAKKTQQGGILGHHCITESKIHGGSEAGVREGTGFPGCTFCLNDPSFSPASQEISTIHSDLKVLMQQVQVWLENLYFMTLQDQPNLGTTLLVI